MDGRDNQGQGTESSPSKTHSEAATDALGTLPFLSHCTCSSLWCPARGRALGTEPGCQLLPLQPSDTALPVLQHCGHTDRTLKMFHSRFIWGLSKYQCVLHCNRILHSGGNRQLHPGHTGKQAPGQRCSQFIIGGAINKDISGSLLYGQNNPVSSFPCVTGWCPLYRNCGGPRQCHHIHHRTIGLSPNSEWWLEGADTACTPRAVTHQGAVEERSWEAPTCR